MTTATPQFKTQSVWNTTSGNSSQAWHDNVANQIHNTTINKPGHYDSPSNDTCRFDTVDGTPCELDGTFDDGHCFWHTEEQCYYIKDNGNPCELSGAHGPDNRCHLHTRGCNESLTHTAVQKACYHGMKFPYRMLGLHPDIEYSDGPFDIQPQLAAEVAVRVAKGYLEVMGEEYDREESHEYYLNNIVEKVVDDQSLLDKIKDEFGFLNNGVRLEIFKKGIDKAWTQIDKGSKPHADGARTAIAAVEHYLGEEIEINAQSTTANN